MPPTRIFDPVSLGTKVDDRFFTPVTYTKTTGGLGNIMNVVLGPVAGSMTGNGGCATSSDSLGSIMRSLNARDHRVTGRRQIDKGYWIAGHLLNAELGGNGVHAQNLTPLTETANKNHSSYETKVKAVLQLSYIWYQHFRRKRDFDIGVQYQVKVSDESFGGFSPYDKVPSHIIVSSRVVIAKHSDGMIFAVADIDSFLSFAKISSPSSMAYLKSCTFEKEEVHNEDSHLGIDVVMAGT